MVHKMALKRSFQEIYIYIFFKLDDKKESGQPTRGGPLTRELYEANKNYLNDIRFVLPFSKEHVKWHS